MTDLEKCDQLQSTLSSSTPELDASTLCSFNCQSPTSTVTLSSPDADNCTKDVGGHKAKLTVLGSFIALFCTFGQINAFGTYQSWYSSHQLQRMSPSAISWIGSLQLWVLFFLVSSILVPDYGSVIQHAIQGWLYWSHVRFVWSIRTHGLRDHSVLPEHDLHQLLIWVSRIFTLSGRSLRCLCCISVS